MDAVADPVDETFSDRQQEVLKAALDLMVQEGDSFSMIAVAKRASCSKETLYKWFGDREGLLTATVRWQASQVRIEAPEETGLDLPLLKARLQDFAARWLSVLSSDNSIALNRLAVSHGASSGDLGTIVLKNGPFAMAARLKPVLETGRAAGLLRFEDSDRAFRDFFGLVVRDVQIRALLGEPRTASLVDVECDAALAVQQFFALYGAKETNRQTQR